MRRRGSALFDVTRWRGGEGGCAKSAGTTADERESPFVRAWCRASSPGEAPPRDALLPRESANIAAVDAPATMFSA